MYLRYPDAVLPSCWAWHPALVEELCWLRHAHRQAYDPATGSVQQAGEWHDRHRPGVVARLQAITRDCDLSRHTDGGDRVQHPPQAPLSDAAAWLAAHWAAHTTPLPTAAQLAAARAADHHDRRAHR